MLCGGVEPFEKMVRFTKHCLNEVVLTTMVEDRRCDKLTTSFLHVLISHLVVGRRLLAVPDNLSYQYDPCDETF